MLPITQFSPGTAAVVQALATAHPATSVACWDTRLQGDHRKELAWKLDSGVELNFSAKVRR